MEINFPTAPLKDQTFTDASSVRWICLSGIVEDANNIQWARVGIDNTINVMPIGSIAAWPNATIPNGWLECNGQVTTAFPDLADITGANVPDLRGEFIRGFDNNKGTDSGRVLGSTQTDDFKSHSHDVGRDLTGQSGTSRSVVAPSIGAATQVPTAAVGGSETRPKNIALIYIIKAFHAESTPTIGLLPSNKNYIINSTFSINQRAFAGGALANAIYGYDRWKATGTSNMTLSGDILTIVSGTATQVVEDFGYTGQVTISWVGTSTVNSGNTSPYTYTKAAGNDTLTFGVGTLSEVKMEIGSIVTPFEYPTIAEEEIRCYRYYYDTGNAIANLLIMGARSPSDTSTARGMNYHYPATMRVVPTSTITGGTNTTSVSGSSKNTTVMRVTASVTSASQTGFITQIILSAEL